MADHRADMDRGLYIAASGMLAEQARQDLIANDLANASTPGYKADRVSQRSFDEVLLSNTRTGADVGPVGAGPAIARQATDLTAAPLRETGEPLDLAVVGEGFFAVQTDQGVRYTRNGAFTTDPGGRLVDQMGNPVLGRGGGPVRVDGEGAVDPRQVGVFAVPGARKAGDGLFTGAAQGQADSVVRTGALEGSGVDPSRVMVDMLASLRAFEAGQKAIQAIDGTLEQATQRVGAMP